MFAIVTFYKFVPLSDLMNKRDRLRLSMREHSMKGTIILADEGFNATVCGAEDKVMEFLPAAREILGFECDYKTSFHRTAPFRRIDVRIKPEIVTLKQPVDMSQGEGTRVGPEEWNAIISDPDTVVLDARNDYELMNGSFPRALNPQTKKFSELPGYVSRNLDPVKHKRIAMYCTGGIRCEKFAPYLRSKGFENVFQLEGGILKYLEVVDPSESLWNGECFVFDDRVTVNQKLKKGSQKDFSVPGADE